MNAKTPLARKAGLALAPAVRMVARLMAPFPWVAKAMALCAAKPYALVGLLLIGGYATLSVTGYEPVSPSHQKHSAAKMRQAGGARAYFSSPAYYRGGK